jgi:hypothetical protein
MLVKHTVPRRIWRRPGGHLRRRPIVPKAHLEGPAPPLIRLAATDGRRTTGCSIPPDPSRHALMGSGPRGDFAPRRGLPRELVPSRKKPAVSRPIGRRPCTNTTAAAGTRQPLRARWAFPARHVTTSLPFAKKQPDGPESPASRAYAPRAYAREAYRSMADWGAPDVPLIRLATTRCEAHLAGAGRRQTQKNARPVATRWASAVHQHDCGS